MFTICELHVLVHVLDSFVKHHLYLWFQSRKIYIFLYIAKQELPMTVMCFAQLKENEE